LKNEKGNENLKNKNLKIQKAKFYFTFHTFVIFHMFLKFLLIRYFTLILFISWNLIEKSMLGKNYKNYEISQMYEKWKFEK
jgi:hypothetical protein